MEQARILIAIVLSFLVFFLWEFFFVDKVPVQEPQKAIETAEKAAPATETAPPPTAKPYEPAPPAPAPGADADLRQEPAKTVTVRTPLYTALLSEKGGTVKSFVLNNYRERVEPDSPLKELIEGEIFSGTVHTAFLGGSVEGLKDATFSLAGGKSAVTVTDRPESVSFLWTSPTGVVVEKRFQFNPDTYLIDLAVNVRNGSDRKIQDNLVVSLRKKFGDSKRAIGFQGPSALIGSSVEQVKVKDIESAKVYAGKVEWIALQDRYFMSALILKTPVEASMRLSADANGIVEDHFIQPEITLAPGTQSEFDYHLFFGPKSMKVLRRAGFDLDRVVDFGWFDIIAKPCLWLMNFIYGFIPNYGVAIIILTLFTKLLLWPLGNKSYKSMSQMKKLQPLMAELREKYKGDKKMVNQEMMALYKTYKINPMGGCLPMVAQIPVFIALYRMLYEAIELRHAPFFGWINDLSAPDRLFRFDFSIPFMEPPYGIPVLTLVMGATMLLQQKMSPPPGDPSQAKMMMLMPIVFTFIFINFSSGLVLYWLVNNILSISQQHYVQKKYA